MKKYLLSLLALMILSNPAAASDSSKYNHRGDTPIKHVVKNLVGNNRVLKLQDTVNQFNIPYLIDNMKSLAKENHDDIWLIITSPGGAVFEGQRFINVMIGLKKSLGIKTNCIIENSAYSMAAIIATYCSKTYMTPGSGLLYHEVSFGLQEQITKMRSRMNHMDQVTHEMNEAISQQLGINLVMYEDFVEHEWWFTSDQAARFGITDGVFIGLVYDMPYDVLPADPLEESAPLSTDNIIDLGWVN